MENKSIKLGLEDVIISCINGGSIDNLSVIFIGFKNKLPKKSVR